MNQAGNPDAGAAVSVGGLLPGMTQPAQQVIFSMVRHKDVDFTRLDRMLVEILGTELVSCKKAGVGASKTDIQLASRILLVCRDLLQAGGVPVFDPGVILAIGRSPGNARANRVRCLFPAIPHVPDRLLREAFVFAGQLVDLLAGKETDRGAVDTLLDRAHTELVKNLKRAMRGGESTVPIIQAAYERGIPFVHLGNSIYRLGWGGRSRLMDRSATESDSAVGARLSQDKLMTSRVLRGAGLPGSRHIRVGTEADAMEAARVIGWPVVVKPADRDRGEGISVDVGDPEALRAAFGKATRFSKSILIEQQAPGVCHRLFVARRKKILFVTQRLPKSVQGDGKRTVSELIDLANADEMKKAPWRRLKPFPDDDFARTCLADAGFTLDSIPAEGQYAPLRRIQSDAEGGVSVDRSREVHPDNAEIVLKAAALFGLDSAGVDLITADISRPWYENGAIINEVNYASLLGGYRTSARTHDYPGQLLDLMIHNRGRVPVEVYVGGERAMAAAVERQQCLAGEQVQCYLTSHSQTRRPDGSVIGGEPPGLFGRTLYLLADPDLEALILVIQTDELLYTGCPVDGLGAVHLVDAGLLDWSNPGNPAAASSRQRLMALLAEFSRSVEPVTRR